MPSTFHLTITLDRPAPRRLQTSMQAALYSLIADVRPSLAGQLHAAQINPLSTGLTRRNGFGGVSGNDHRTLQVRVSCADDHLLPALREALSVGLIPAERHDELQGRVIGVDEWHVPYEDLASSGPSCQLTFHSPTLLKSADVFIDRPSSALLLHSALRRWQAFSPETAPDQAWNWVHEHVMTTAQEIQTLCVSLPKQPKHHTAFLGTLNLQYARTSEGEWLARVTHLLPFTGVGIKTLYGYGEVTVASI